MSQETADEVIASWEERLQDLGGGDEGVPDGLEKAVSELVKEIESGKLRKRRAQLKQALKVDAIRTRIQGTGDRAAAASHAVLDLDSGGLEFAGENVQLRRDNVRGQAFALMVDFIQQGRSKFAGLVRETTHLRDVIRSLHGIDAPREAKIAADGLMEARRYLINRFNRAGGDIRMREDFGWTHKHNAQLMVQAGKEAWIDFVKPRLDPSKMFNSAGEPMTGPQLQRALEETYDSVTGKEATAIGASFSRRFGSPVNARAQHRELAFKSPDDWFDYQQEFGDRDIFESIIGEIEQLSRDVALIEVLGPYPRATVEAMKTFVDEELTATLRGISGREAARIQGNIGEHQFLSTLFEQVNGTANIPADKGFAVFAQSTRSLLTGAQLGSAAVVSLGDIATNTLTARMSGISQARLMGQLLRQLNPASNADRELAARAGYIAETWAGAQVGAQRLLGEVTGVQKIARITDTVLRASGLNAMTDGNRNAFKLEMVGHMTDQAANRFDDVEPALRNTLTKYGVTPDEWDVYRNTARWRDQRTGASFIRPEDIYLNVRDTGPPEEVQAALNIANKIGEIVHSEARLAVITPTARSRAVSVGNTRAGTFWGEVVRNTVLYKSFLISFTMQHGARFLAQGGLKNLQGAGYLAHLIIGMTMAGAVAEQASQISQGKQPRNMVFGEEGAEAFWASAVFRGGGLGALGEVLYSAVASREYPTVSFISSLIGPVGALIEAGVDVPINAAFDLIQDGEFRSLGRDLSKFVENLTPGKSLWYAKLAYERVLFDTLEELIDGGEANERFRRMERNAQKEFDQDFWWRPGELRPE